MSEPLATGRAAWRGRRLGHRPTVLDHREHCLIALLGHAQLPHTPRGVAVCCSRHLKALSERGAIRRLPYKLSGFNRGSGQFVYTPPDSKARIPNLHTLDITELMVRLGRDIYVPSKVEFNPEPWWHDTWGGYALKHDAYVKLPGRHYFIEIDRGTEFASALSGQMNKYVSAFYGMDGGSFPQVLFLAHDADRVPFINRVIKKKKVPGLFVAALYDDAIGLMCDVPALG